jgi:hypothetical protein
MRLQHVNAAFASVILTHGGANAAFGLAWQRWAIAGVKTVIFPAFFLCYAAAPRFFHRFMAFHWHMQCERMTMLINDIKNKASPDFLAHPASLKSDSNFIAFQPLSPIFFVTLCSDTGVLTTTALTLTSCFCCDVTLQTLQRSIITWRIWCMPALPRRG